jgi:hypothetical protein
VAAIPAEVEGEEPLFGVRGKKLLALDSDSAPPRLFKGREGMTRARDELMQLEPEEAARTA